MDYPINNLSNIVTAKVVLLTFFASFISIEFVTCYCCRERVERAITLWKAILEKLTI